MKVNVLAYKAYKVFRVNKIRSLIIKFLLKREGFGYSPSVRYIFEKAHGITIGYGSVKIGCLNIHNIKGKVSFGNYCSIAKSVKFFLVNHPTNLFTSHAITYNPLLQGVQIDKLDRSRVLIVEDDVWIGEGVIVLPNVNKIGRGAIIGAGSIVTKDVPSYSVVAGNPAKFIRKRFDEDTIKKLEETRWWEMEKDILVNHFNDLNSLVSSKKAEK